jgi:hypothetical protein
MFGMTVRCGVEGLEQRVLVLKGQALNLNGSAWGVSLEEVSKSFHGTIGALSVGFETASKGLVFRV